MSWLQGWLKRMNEQLFLKAEMLSDPSLPESDQFEMLNLDYKYNQIRGVINVFSPLLVYQSFIFRRRRNPSFYRNLGHSLLDCAVVVMGGKYLKSYAHNTYWEEVQDVVDAYENRIKDLKEEDSLWRAD